MMFKLNESLGVFDLHQNEYRKDCGLANSGALLIARSPSDYVWSKSAPSNAAKSTTGDFGTALHCALLEPEQYNDLVIVTGIKGRTTKGFIELQAENPEHIILTEDEAEQVRIMVASVMAHPAAAFLINADGKCESSMFINDKETGVRLKCRPDKDAVRSLGYIVDVKTTACIDDWRSDKEWVNPLFKYNYGHQASFYTDIAEQFYNTEINQFVFLAVQKTSEFGKYPVAVFVLTKEQMIEQGFWTSHRVNIDTFKHCIQNNAWLSFESFNLQIPSDFDYSDDVEVVFDGEQSC